MTSHHSTYPRDTRHTLTRVRTGERRLRLLRAIQAFAERVWSSGEYAPALVVLASIALCADQALGGCAALACAAAFMLLFCSDILAALLPLLLFSLLTTAFYEKMGELLQIWPVFVIAVLSLLAHLLLYPATAKKGTMTYPLLVLTAATLLGGAGTIAAGDYFAPVSLYYMLGLGAGMLLTYTVVRAQLSRKRDYDVLERFLTLLYYAGLFAGIVVVDAYLTHFTEFVKSGSVIYMSYRNFCATILLLAMPAACIRTSGGSARWFGLLFLYAGLLLSGSRSGLLFGTAELLCCLLWLYRSCPAEKLRAYRITALIAIPAAVVGMALLIPNLFASRMTGGQLISMSESRVTFFLQALKDFASNPLFGIGLGNMSNKGIFIGVTGSIVWYHNLPAQILGSMGLLGAAAYGWYYFKRAKLLLTRQSAYLPLAALCAMGMLLVSMTNPGEFCPLPNELVMVMLFAIVEQLPKRENGKLTKMAR